MSFKNCSALASLLFLATLSAQAGVVVDLVDSTGRDSGWSATLPDNVNYGIVVDRLTSGYVRIEISKTFTEGPVCGQFPGVDIPFHQRLSDANTVGVIQITDEIITNRTGVDWTDYHWQIVGPPAAFDRTATDSPGSPFSVNPFTVKTWGPAQSGWDANHPASLDVSGGVVPDLGTFGPGLDSGRLYIAVNLASADRDFTLSQHPTPEPGTMALLALGALAALRRRSRRP